MENYRLAEKALKVGVENIIVLHHNIVSSNFHSDHERMEQYYRLALDCADSIIENGISINIPEVSIVEALEDFEALPVRSYPKAEAYAIVQSMFNEFISLLAEAKNEERVPDYIRNLIEEWQQQFDLEANYKIAHLLAAEKSTEEET